MSIAATILIASQMSLCGLRFEVPRGWTVRKTLDRLTGKGCAFGMKPPKWDDIVRKNEYDDRGEWMFLPDYPITVVVSSQPTVDLAGSAGFVRIGDLREIGEQLDSPLKDDDWIISGLWESRASPIHGKTWRGQFANRYVRIGRTQTMHIGSDEYSALLIERRPGRRTAVATCDVWPPTHCAAERTHSRVVCNRQWGPNVDFGVLMRSIEFSDHPSPSTRPSGSR